MKRILVVLFFFGCSDAGVEPFVDLNTATATLTNHTPETIYYMAIDGELLTHIDWIPSNDPNNPKKIPSGGSVLFSSKDITGYRAGEDFVFFWWTLRIERGTSQYVVTNFNSKIVTT